MDQSACSSCDGAERALNSLTGSNELATGESPITGDVLAAGELAAMPSPAR